MRAVSTWIVGFVLVALAACSGSPEPAQVDAGVDAAADAVVAECSPGEVVACYDGPPSTQDVGACHAGTKTCDADGHFGSCTGSVIPAVEDCATTADEDCDGEVNESDAGCACAPNAERSCYTGPTGTADVGLCTAGTQVCDASGTAWGACNGEVVPAAEDCASSADDDCDGQANESDAGCVCMPDTQQSCYSGPAGTLGVGICSAGMQTCDASGTAWGSCNGEVVPATESCTSSLDDDCDGQANESGAGCVCMPGTQQSCYTGPAGTEGVGICSGGMQTCDASGTAWGSCNGEVVPATESCTSSLDDDCDGQANESGAGCVCVPGAQQSCYSGPAATEGVGTCQAGVQTCDASGTAYGGCVGEVLPAQEVCGAPADEDCDGFSCGQGVWSLRAGTTGTSDGRVVKTDGAGNVYIAGTFDGVIDLGGSPVLSSADDVFLAKYTSAGGFLWAQHFGNSGNDRLGGLDVDAAGNILLAVQASGPIDMGGGWLAGTTFDVVVARFDSAGQHVWSKRFGDATSPQVVLAATWDGSGNALVTGSFSGTLDFGGGPLTASSGSDLFVAKLAAAGTHVWSKRFGGAPGGGNGYSIDVDANDNVLMSGTFTGTIDFGGGPLTSAGASDIYLVKLASSGSHVWSKRYGDASGQTFAFARADATGDVFIAIQGAGTVDLGTGPLASAGSSDIFVARLGSGGTAVWAKRFGSANTQSVRDLATDEAGALVITGSTNSSVDFGGGALVPAGQDIYVVKLSSVDGSYQFARLFGDAASQTANSVAQDASGAIYVIGFFIGAIDFTGTAMVAVSSADLFLAKLAP